MKCHFCGRYAPANLNDAIDDGWIPSYWDGKNEITEPVCGDCFSDRLRIGPEDGEIVMRHLRRLWRSIEAVKPKGKGNAMMITKSVGSYDSCHPSANECMICVRLPSDAPATNISETWEAEDGPDIDDVPPSEVIELISARVESYLASTSQDEKRKTIQWCRENYERLDALWAHNQIKRLNALIRKLTDRRRILTEDFLDDD